MEYGLCTFPEIFWNQDKRAAISRDRKIVLGILVSANVL
jgi:hypothetical protein